MNEIRQLMNIIRKKDENEELTIEEKSILDHYYDEYMTNVHPRKENGDIKSIEDISLLEVFEYVSQPLVEKRKKLEEINLFKTLLKYKGTSVKLSDLYKAVYTGIYTDEEIEINIKDLNKMEEFFKKLNGAIIEETVFGIDMSRFNPYDFGTIDTTITEFDDPVLFIKSLKPVELYEVALSQEDKVTILTFPDLHIEAGCYFIDEQGNKVIDQERLNERLISFINFRDSLIMKLRNEGIHVTGIVYTGDILETFVMKDNSDTTERITRINNLVDSFIQFEEDARKGKIINGESARLASNDSYFVAFLAGNHDIRIGREAFNKIMSLFGNATGRNVIDLGNGSARIKIGEEFVSFMHHNSLDWNTKDKDEMILRKAKNRETYHFEEYFKICESYFLTPEFQELMTQNPNIDPIKLLMNCVNQKMKEENPRLYHAYLPYIIINSETEGEYSRNDQLSEDGLFTHIVIQKNIPFFRNFMEIETIDNQKKLIKRTKLEKGRQVEVLPVTEHFTSFVESNNEDLLEMSYTERLHDASKEYIEYLKARGKNDIAEKLEKVIHKIIPQFGRIDRFSPIIYSLSHFHEQPQFFANEVGERLTMHTNVDSPIVYLEGKTIATKDLDIGLLDYGSFQEDRSIITMYASLCNKIINQPHIESKFLKKESDPDSDEMEFLMTMTNEYINEEARKAIAKYKVNGGKFNSEREKNSFENLMKLYYAVASFSHPNIDKYIEGYSLTLTENGMSIESEEYKKRMSDFRTAVAEMPNFRDYLEVKKDGSKTIICVKSKQETRPLTSNEPITSEKSKETQFTAGLISINTSFGKISSISLKALMTKVMLIKENPYYYIGTKIVEGTECNQIRR